MHDIKFHLWASSACQDAFFWTTAFSLRRERVAAQAVLTSAAVKGVSVSFEAPAAQSAMLPSPCGWRA